VNAASAQAIDPVCGMTVPIGPTTEHVELGGADYWFCCPACRTAFAAGKAGV
jgi:xanthine dehydrogenase accessory factor